MKNITPLARLIGIGVSWFCLVTVALVVAAPAAPADASAVALPPLPKDDAASEWSFEAAPKAFQKNPLVPMTVITELTALGRQQPPPSPNRPTYFAATVTPVREEGRNDAGTRPLPPEVIGHLMQQALATNGFLPADAAHPPSLMISYLWGTFNRPAPNHPDVGNRNAVARASLVGGEKFAAEFEKAMVRDQTMMETGGYVSANSAFRQFRRRNDKTEQLVEQARSDIYFIVASAFDYQALAHNQRQLLWRTKMTVDSRGVSMADTLPELASSSAAFLGREMTESALLLRRANREGKVDIGNLKVVDPAAPTKTPSEADKK